MSSNVLVLILSVIVILSYFYSIISRRTKIPSVIFLLSTGIIIKQFSPLSIRFEVYVNRIVEILGIVGLIMIILEAGLDLHITRDKRSMILKAFLSALIILVFSSFSIAFLINFWLGESWFKSLVYAVPLSIVSSAIIIPSIHMLSDQKKEFLVYESSFSDILGILFFNYLVGNSDKQPIDAAIYLFQMLLATVLSMVLAVALIYLLGRLKLSIKFFLIFAVLVALYAIGKILHLPSLLIILLFGLIINNRQFFHRFRWLDNHIPNIETFKNLELQLKTITAETSFLVRTYFFIVFGYSINLLKLTQPEVIFLGSMTVLVLLLIRFIFIKYLNPKESGFPEVLLMPRGLITILLFYNIPKHYHLTDFNNGILFFVILTTSFLMLIGLLAAREEKLNVDV